MTMAQTQRTLTKDDVREAALSVLRELVSGIEEGRVEPMSVNLDFVNMDCVENGEVWLKQGQQTTVTFTTVQKD